MILDLTFFSHSYFPQLLLFDAFIPRKAVGKDMACSTYGKEVDKESNLYDRHLGKRRFRLEPSRSSCFTNFFTLDVGNRTNLLQKSQVFDDRLHRGDVVREFILLVRFTI